MTDIWRHGILDFDELIEAALYKRRFRSDPRREDLISWASEVETKQIEWLWRGRILRGALNGLEGDPDKGKSLICADYAARLSHDEEDTRNPDGTPIHGAPYTSIIVSAEDDISRVVKPRLEAAGANLGLIAFLKLRYDAHGQPIPFTVPDDLARLEAMIRVVGDRAPCGFVVIDPLAAFVSENVNTHNDSSMRRALTPLSELAERMNVAVLCLRHWTKDASQKALYRGGGSIAITAAFRSVLQAGEHPDQDDVRVLAQAKANYVRSVESWSYRIVESRNPGHPIIEWLATSEFTADQVARFSTDGRLAAPQRREAKEVIRRVLAEGPALQSVVTSAIREAELSRSTQQRAERALRVHKYPIHSKAGQIEAWMAHLPETPCPEQCGQWRASVGADGEDEPV